MRGVDLPPMGVRRRNAESSFFVGLRSEVLCEKF